MIVICNDKIKRNRLIYRYTNSCKINHNYGFCGKWRNALSDNRRQDDRLAVGAYEDGRLIGLAGCSADCERMWQIGVDVLPEYRRRGVAAAVTSQLAVACLERGIVPFYCCAWSNLKSVGNALKSGFRPGWIQLTVMPDEWIARMNHQ